MRIYKYELKEFGENRIAMPCGAQVLSTGIDPKGQVCIWALVDEKQENEDKYFMVAGTGWNLTTMSEAYHSFENYIYVFKGTVIQDSYVWHIFEKQFI